MADVNLVLDKFEFTPDAPQKVVELRGRTSGPLGFLLSRLGLSQQSFLIITREDVQFRFVSLSGITTILCPLDTITSAYCGVGKPMWALWVGIVFVIALPTIILPLIGLVLLFHFYRTKFLTLTFSTGDMLDTHGLDFAAFTKDGKRVTVENLLEIVEYVNTVLMNVRPDPIVLPTRVISASVPASPRTEAIEPEEIEELPEISLDAPKVGEVTRQVADKAGALFGRVAQGAKAAADAGREALQRETEKRRKQQLIQRLSDDSVELFRQKKYDEALEKLQEALLLDPENPSIQNAIQTVEKKIMGEMKTVSQEMAQLAVLEIETSGVYLSPEDELIEDAPPPVLTEEKAAVLTLSDTTAEKMPEIEDDIDAELAVLFGESAPEPAPPIVEKPVSPAAEKPILPAKPTPPTAEKPTATKPVLPPTEKIVLPPTEKISVPSAAKNAIPTGEPKTTAPNKEASPAPSGQLVDTKPRKAVPAADTLATQLVDTKPKKSRPVTEPLAAAPMLPTIEAPQIEPSAAPIKTPPSNADIWKTGEMQAVLPVSGATGTLDLDKQIARQKLREGFDFFQKKKYMDALVSLKEAQALDPDNPKVKEGIQACEQRLRRQ